MDPVSIHLLGVGGITLLALGTFLVVRSPLTELVSELCGSGARGSFWVRLYAVTLVVAVAFFGVLYVPSRGEPLSILAGVLRQGLLGLLASLAVLAVVLVASIRSYEARRGREERAAERAEGAGPAAAAAGRPC